MCVSRFEQTYVRERHEEKVIDLTIALESTLLADVEEELSYRLAMRGARLLSTELSPEYSFDLLRALYKARSKIVHEGKQLQAQTRAGLLAGRPVEDFVADATDWVRRAIREYLRLVAEGKSLKSVAALLDKRVLNSS